MKLVLSPRYSFPVFLLVLFCNFSCKKESINIAYPDGTKFKTMHIKGYNFAGTELENLDTKLTVLNFGSFSKQDHEVRVAFKPSTTKTRFVFRNTLGDVLKQIAFTNNNRDTSFVFVNTGESVVINPTIQLPQTNKMGLMFGLKTNYSSYTGPVDLEFHLSDNNKQPLPAVAFVLPNIQLSKLTVKYDLPKPSNVVGVQYTKNPYIVYVRQAGTSNALPYNGTVTNPNPTIASFQLVFTPNTTKVLAITDERLSNYNIRYIAEDITNYLK